MRSRFGPLSALVARMPQRSIRLNTLSSSHLCELHWHHPGVAFGVGPAPHHRFDGCPLSALRTGKCFFSFQRRRSTRTMDSGTDQALELSPRMACLSLPEVNSAAHARPSAYVLSSASELSLRVDRPCIPLRLFQAFVRRGTASSRGFAHDSCRI